MITLSHTLRITGLALLLPTSSLHAQHGAHAYLLGRPNVHLSFGSVGVVQDLPHDQPLMMDDMPPDGASGEAMVRVKGPWLVGASYSQYESKGDRWHTDSVTTVTYYDWFWEIFGGDPYVTETTTWGDAVHIDLRSKAVELLGAYEYGSAHPRHLIHFTGRASMGFCAQFLQETHHHALNIPAGYTVHRSSGQQVNAMGWTWILRLRCDLHFTRLLSLFTEVEMVQQLGDVRMPGTSVTENGETSTANARSVDLSGGTMRGGVSLHF